MILKNCRISDRWGAYRPQSWVIPQHAWDPRLPAVQSWRERISGR